ncbi:MAG TPA: tetratricopeptide repeat protein, partial [Fimbriimonadaceae bacterium]|nr:tetratricopeptide repeat protein [Fimbriimonadaceae bacterium]
MFRRLVPVAALIAFFAPATLYAAPEVLIVQRLSKDKDDFNVPVVQHLAEQLDIEGRVSPIVWSMLDPVFRAYVDDGKLPGFVENPDDKKIRDYAGRLHVRYVLVVEAVARNGQVIPQAQLFEGTRSSPLWSMVREEKRGKPRLVVVENGKVDEDKTLAIREKYANVLSEGTMTAMAVLINGQPDWDGTAKTLARTWTRILAEGPFSKLEPQRRTFVPDADPGLGFGTETTATILPAPATGKALERAKLLSQDGKYDDAILVLRDAIDADPFNTECRQEFAKLLIKVGEPDLAAREAERAAHHLEDPGEMWALAAEGWVEEGDDDKALEAANQARARGVDTPEILLVLGEVWLMKGDPQKSLDDYNAP